MKKTNPNGSRTLYIGGVYEVDKSSSGNVTATRNYYPAAGAMRINSTLYFIRKDHLGSASAVTDASGNIVGKQLYDPFGGARYVTGTMYTDRLYTGQREITGLGIYHYNARFYSPYINRFLSADTIVPGMSNPQNLNRYSYVRNKPLRYTDPSGHEICDEDGNCYNQGQKYRNKHRKYQTPEQKFIRRAKSPLHENDGPVHYSGFGGCNTITGSCNNGHHPALDSRNNWNTGEIVNWSGRPIYATEYGVVIRTGSSDWGNYVMVQHTIDGENFYSIYAHLQAATVVEGAAVDHNTQIGEMGGTTRDGNVDPHLHFEVRRSQNVDLAKVNPFQGALWWPRTLDELKLNFVDLGATSFGNYDSNYFSPP